MSKVIAQFTMSLDGFIATPDDGVDLLFRWYSNGEVEFPVSGTDRKFRISRASADLIREEWDTLGAIVTGRGDFDASAAWGGEAILGVPMFIVTHRPPQEWTYPGSPFTFVTEGVDQAVELARTAAGGLEVGVGGSTITQQCLSAGLLDEIRMVSDPQVDGVGRPARDTTGDRARHPGGGDGLPDGRQTGALGLRPYTMEPAQPRWRPSRRGNPGGPVRLQRRS